LLRPLLINPVLIFGVSVIGAAICRLNGADWHPRELFVASGVGLIAAELAVIVAVSRRGADTAETAITALLALGLQLLLSLILGAVAMFTHQVGMAFVWWMMVMFWVTLLGVSAVLVRLVRAAAAASLVKSGVSAPFDKLTAGR
jgi:hypothetical protein